MANKKKTIFERAKAGVKTTFGIRDLTPQQKVEIEKKRKETQAYKQMISERQKQAWQIAYRQELTKQRQLYAKQKEREAIQRGITKAQQEIQVMAQPKEKFAWLTAPARAIEKAMPKPSPKIQKQLDVSLREIIGGGAPVTKRTTFQGMIFGAPSKQPKQKRGKQQKIDISAGLWDIPLEKPIKHFTAQAMEHKLKKGKSKLKIPKQQKNQFGDMFWKL